MFILPPKEVRYTKSRSTQPVFDSEKIGSVSVLRRKKVAAEAQTRHYDFNNISRIELAEILRSGELDDLETLEAEIETATTMVDGEKFDFVQYLEGRIAFCEENTLPTAPLHKLLAKILQLQGQARQPKVDAYV